MKTLLVKNSISNLFSYFMFCNVKPQFFCMETDYRFTLFQIMWFFIITSQCPCLNLKHIKYTSLIMLNFIVLIEIIRNNIFSFKTFGLDTFILLKFPMFSGYQLSYISVCRKRLHYSPAPGCVGGMFLPLLYFNNWI